MERESYINPQWALIAIVAVLAALLLWQALGPALASNQAPDVVWARPVPTLQPTPPIELPAGSTLRAAEPQIHAEGSTVTITNNYTYIDTDICVALICPPAGQ